MVREAGISERMQRHETKVDAKFAEEKASAFGNQPPKYVSPSRSAFSCRRRAARRSPKSTRSSSIASRADATPTTSSTQSARAPGVERESVRVGCGLSFESSSTTRAQARASWRRFSTCSRPRCGNASSPTTTSSKLSTSLQHNSKALRCLFGTFRDRSRASRARARAKTRKKRTPPQRTTGALFGRRFLAFRGSFGLSGRANRVIRYTNKLQNSLNIINSTNT